MFTALKSEHFTVISYEVEPVNEAGVLLYRATLVVRAKGGSSETTYIDMLRDQSDITVEKVV